MYVKILHSGSTWYDLTDYVTECDNIPVLARNHDFSLVAEGLSLKVSSKFTGCTITIDDLIVIANDSELVNVLYAGYVTDSPFDYKDKSYKVTISHPLQKLKNYYVEYDVTKSSLSSYIAAEVESIKFNPSTNANYKRSVISVVGLIRALFRTCGLDINISSFNTAKTYVLGSMYGHSLIDNVSKNLTSETIYLQSIYLMPNMVYAINQDVAVNYSVIDTDVEMSAKKITCWDLVSRLCSLFGFQFTFSNYDSFSIKCNFLASTSNMQLGDLLDVNSINLWDYSLEYTKEKMNLNSLYYQFKWRGDTTLFLSCTGYTTSSTWSEATVFDGATQYDLGDAPSGKSTTAREYNVISHYNNLVFYWIGELNGGTYKAYSILPPYLSRLEIATYVHPYRLEKFTTDIYTGSDSLLDVKINVKDRTSEIQQEILL